MADQWKAIDSMIDEAYQEYQLKLKESSNKVLDVDADMDVYFYLHIRDYLKNHKVFIDDAVRNRIYSFVAKRHPFESRFAYYEGVKSLQDIVMYYTPAELREQDPDGLIDKTIPIRDQIMKHRILQYEKNNNVSSGESFTATLTTSLVNPMNWVGFTGGVLAKVVFFGAELTNAWFSSKDRPSEAVEKEQNKVEVKYIPQWMFRQMKFDCFSTASLHQLKVAQKWAEGNAKIYERRLELMRSQNKHYVRVGNQTISIDVVKQRIEEYKLFASKAREAQIIPESLKKGFPVPIDKITEATDEQLAEAAKFCVKQCDVYINKYNAAIKNGTLSFKEGGEEHSFYDYDVRSRQCIIYAEKIQKEAERRVAAAQAAAETAQQKHRSSQGNSSVHVASSVHSPARTNQNNMAASSQQQPSQNVIVSPQVQYPSRGGQAVPQTSPLNGWDGLMSNDFGFSNFDDVKDNMGYILAMLPDMLVGMFTGKSRNLKFKDNVFPIAAIMMGLFMKRNPLLKMLLIGFGGIQLFKKASTEILEYAGVKSREPKQYKQYSNETLDPRLKNVAMKGNTMLADIDGKPMVLTISETAVDAYYKGKLPLNTLANAVLKKYDAQQSELSLSYERDVVKNQQQQRNVQIK